MLKLAILGHGRAGKDTCGEWLGIYTPLRYVGSTSMVVCPMIAEARGVTPEQAWQTRHQERDFWYKWANEYRKDDPAKLAKKCLETGDIVVGLRDKLELDACKAADLFDLIIWIHRDVPEDPTVTFTEADCDITIDNTKDHDELYAKMTKLMSLIGVRVFKEPVKQIVLPSWTGIPPKPDIPPKQPWWMADL